MLLDGFISPTPLLGHFNSLWVVNALMDLQNMVDAGKLSSSGIYIFIKVHCL